MPMQPAETSTRLLSHILPRVSRSFYLSLRVLPQCVRPTIGLAYLFCRAADTIADTSLFLVLSAGRILSNIDRCLPGKPLGHRYAAKKFSGKAAELFGTRTSRSFARVLSSPHGAAAQRSTAHPQLGADTNSGDAPRSDYVSRRK